MDLLYLLIPVILMTLSQMYIKSTYSKYNGIKSKNNMTGFDTAKIIVDKYKLNIKIEKTQGVLTDHFDPKTNVIRLSTDVYEKDSIASIAIAAHECAHVIQYKEGYIPMKIRRFLVPIVSLSSKLGYIIITIGFLSTILNLVLIGIILMVLSLVFQLVTLPVEFNASKRAKEILIKEKTIVP
jgi:hypothetical protein